MKHAIKFSVDTINGRSCVVAQVYIPVVAHAVCKVAGQSFKEAFWDWLQEKIKERPEIEITEEQFEKAYKDAKGLEPEP